ncbi:hypothetical protein YC2023_022000 [Brassica napus]
MKVYQLVNLASIRVSQAELRQRLMQLPKYLRVAIRHCILRKDASLSSDGTLMHIGMDAQVVYGFHNLRNEKPYLANGRPYRQ